MAYVSNFITQAISATTAVTLPPHVTDDIIVVAVSGDGGGTLSFTWGGNSTGGAQVGTTQVSGLLLTSAVSTAKATGTAATCTVTMGTADSMWVHMFIIKDCDTTTWLDASNATVATTALEITTASVTTTTADCLLLYYLAIDNATAAVPEAAHSRPGPTATMHFLDSSDNGSTSVSFNYDYTNQTEGGKRTGGTDTAVTLVAGKSGSAKPVVVATSAAGGLTASKTISITATAETDRAYLA